MKYRGKYEKRREPVVKMQPKAKSMLLQTYLASLLCMVLCVTMFAGTSYAWFTCEVRSDSNEICVGILDVGLFKGEGSGRVSLAGSGNQLFDSGIRWEPGHTTVETIQIVNEGDLAFRYELTFVPEGDVEAAAGSFEVWVYDQTGNGAPNTAAISEANGWVNAGTLAQLLDSGTVLTGSMEEQDVRTTEAEPGETNPGTTDGIATAHTYMIALRMKEDADIAVMGQQIRLNVKLVAYQLAAATNN